MRLYPYLTTLLFCCVSFFAAGQDVHFTLHDYNPLWLNPAQTGGFAGSVRVGGIYRGQWYSLNGINTPSAYADAPVLRGLRKYDWIGVGANLISDRAGASDFGLTATTFGFSGAYHLALDDRRRNVFTLGAQYGSTSYDLDLETMLTQEVTIDQALGGGGQLMGEFTGSGSGNPMGPGAGTGNGESFNSINVGIMLRSVLDVDKDNMFEVGAALLHLNSPERQTLLERSMGQDTVGMGPQLGGNTADDRRRRSTLHGHARLDLEMSEKWRLQPSLFVQSSAANTTISIQAWGSRNLKRDMDLRLGLGYRTGDAAQVLVGLDYKQLRAALSYDITLSQARDVTNFQGGFELAAAYIFNIYKKPTVVPTMLCPRI